MLPTTPPNLTVQGTILGTFQYMAPEQLEGQEADARTDIFAFGAVLYEMVTGRKAFEGKSQASLIGAILKDTPAPMSTLRPLAPPLLDHIVQRCLAKDPDERWQTAADLKVELQWVTQAAPAPLPVPLASRSTRPLAMDEHRATGGTSCRRRDPRARHARDSSRRKSCRVRSGASRWGHLHYAVFAKWTPAIRALA